MFGQLLYFLFTITKKSRKWEGTNAAGLISANRLVKRLKTQWPIGSFSSLSDAQSVSNLTFCELRKYTDHKQTIKMLYLAFSAGLCMIREVLRQGQIWILRWITFILRIHYSCVELSHDRTFIYIEAYGKRNEPYIDFLQFIFFLPCLM